MPWSKAGLSIGMGLLILASLLHARRTRTFRTVLGATTLALLIPFLISALISDDLARGWKEWTSLWPLLFPFLGAAAVRDAPRPRVFLAVLLASTSFATFPALSHFAQQLAEHGQLLDKIEPPTNIWLYTLALCSGALVAASCARDSSTMAVRLGLLALLGLHLVALFATQRRILILVTLALLLGSWLLHRPGAQNRRRLVLGGVAVIAVGAIAAGIDPRIRELTHPSALLLGDSSRALMWEFAWDQYQDAPVFGMGIGDVRDALHAHADEVELQIRIENRSREPEDKVIVNLHHAHCHSNFLHTLAVAGSVGFLAMLAWLIALPATLARGWNRSREAVLLGLSAWALLFLGGVTDASMYSSSRLSAFTLVFAYAWGMLLRPEPAASDAAVD